MKAFPQLTVCQNASMQMAANSPRFAGEQFYCVSIVASLPLLFLRAISTHRSIR